MSAIDLDAIEARWANDMRDGNYSAGTEEVDRRQVLDLVTEVRRLESVRNALVERLQLMAAAERESAKESTARAVAYETAAQMVAGGSPL